MSENVTELNVNQRRAIPALLSHGTVSGAAAALGLAEKTIYRYLKNDVFRNALDNEVRGLIDAAGVRLFAGAENALETLSVIMKHGGVSDRRLAATSWLGFVIKWRELVDIEGQISEIIRRLDEIEINQNKKSS